MGRDLLPQPGGFQGLVAVAVVLEVEQTTLAEPGYRCRSDLGLDSAATSSESERAPAHGLVPDGPHVVEGDLEYVEALLGVLEIPSQPIGSPEGPLGARP